MASETLPKMGAAAYWDKRWLKRELSFHNLNVNRMLDKHLDKLIPDVSKGGKVFVPLCGKSVDMKWLADKGLTVVGMDCTQTALEEFCKDNSITYTTERVKDDLQVLKSADGRFRLYCGDVLEFNGSVEGHFDAIWDRAALPSIEPRFLPTYVENLKKLLAPEGHLLLELMEFDMNIMNDMPEGRTKPPPPYSIYESEIRPFFEPDHTVEFLDRHVQPLRGKDVDVTLYLILKK